MTNKKTKDLIEQHIANGGEWYVTVEVKKLLISSTGKFVLRNLFISACLTDECHVCIDCHFGNIDSSHFLIGKNRSKLKKINPDEINKALNFLVEMIKQKKDITISKNFVAKNANEFVNECTENKKLKNKIAVLEFIKEGIAAKIDATEKKAIKASLHNDIITKYKTALLVAYGKYANHNNLGDEGIQNTK